MLADLLAQVTEEAEDVDGAASPAHPREAGERSFRGPISLIESPLLTQDLGNPPQVQTFTDTVASRACSGETLIEQRSRRLRLAAHEVQNAELTQRQRFLPPQLQDLPVAAGGFGRV